MILLTGGIQIRALGSTDIAKSACITSCNVNWWEWGRSSYYITSPMATSLMRTYSGGHLVTNTRDSLKVENDCEMLLGIRSIARVYLAVV